MASARGVAIALAAVVALTATAPQAAAGPKRHQKNQKPPVSLGTSGGNVENISFVACCSGTLGALVEKNGLLHILSNNHVIARRNQARAGEAISQPGMIDSGCRVAENDLVADLYQFKKIKFGGGRNKADAALAQVRDGMVKSNGHIVGIGVPGTGVVPPKVGLAVKKSGRTSGLTRGTVEALNVSVTVGMSVECGSEETKDARFTNQMVIFGRRDKPFSEPGDSGAVVYVDRKRCPAAVGLLFAGARTLLGTKVTLVSPMNGVLKALRGVKPRGKVSLVGCSAEPEPESATLAVDREARLRHRAMRKLEAIQKRTEDGILAIPGVLGMGIGAGDRDAETAFKVFVSTRAPEALLQVPAAIDGVPVEVLVTEPFVAECPEIG